ncbi:hypothetical protein Tcan_05540 [Toxocara canis]|uniref:Uncharacterized protein n=1 Tax=Toxocara canis TaxID=6265 RepID=A0A0B2V4B0_TOXCA|nr:hypothetical protein Tcan_05540 [Toxocara canis]
MASPRSKDRCNRCVVDYAYKVSHLNIVDQIVTDQADKQAHLCRNESSTDSHADVHTQHLRRTLSQYQTAKANSKLRRKTNLYPSSNTSLAPQEYNRESPPPIAPQKVTFDRYSARRPMRGIEIEEAERTGQYTGRHSQFLFLRTFYMLYTI